MRRKGKRWKGQAETHDVVRREVLFRKTLRVDSFREVNVGELGELGNESVGKVYEGLVGIGLELVLMNT